MIRFPFMDWGLYSFHVIELKISLPSLDDIGFLLAFGHLWLVQIDASPSSFLSYEVVDSRYLCLRIYPNSLLFMN